MGYLLLAKPVNSTEWTYGKWFSTHGEAQFWVHTIPAGTYSYKIMEINENLLKEKDSGTNVPEAKPTFAEDDDIPSEVITPQCNLDEECESCQ
jgi:hypothetical protein